MFLSPKINALYKTSGHSVFWGGVKILLLRHACAACANESKNRIHRRRRCLIRGIRPDETGKQTESGNRNTEAAETQNKQARILESLPFSSVYPQWWLILVFGRVLVFIFIYRFSWGVLKDTGMWMFHSRLVARVWLSLGIARFTL